MSSPFLRARRDCSHFERNRSSLILCTQTLRWQRSCGASRQRVTQVVQSKPYGAGRAGTVIGFKNEQCIEIDRDGRENALAEQPPRDGWILSMIPSGEFVCKYDFLSRTERHFPIIVNYSGQLLSDFTLTSAPDTNEYIVLTFHPAVGLFCTNAQSEEQKTILTSELPNGNGRQTHTIANETRSQSLLLLNPVSGKIVSQVATPLDGSLVALRDGAIIGFDPPCRIPRIRQFSGQDWCYREMNRLIEWNMTNGAITQEIAHGALAGNYKSSRRLSVLAFGATPRETSMSRRRA